MIAGELLAFFVGAEFVLANLTLYKRKLLRQLRVGRPFTHPLQWCGVGKGYLMFVCTPNCSIFSEWAMHTSHVLLTGAVDQMY